MSTPQKGCVRAASECALTPLNTPFPPPGCALHGCIPSIEQVPHNRQGCPPCGTSRKPTSHSWQTLAGTPVKQFPLQRAESSPREFSSGSCSGPRLRKAVGERVHTQAGTSSTLLPATAQAPRYHLQLPAGTLIDLLSSHTARDA